MASFQIPQFLDSGDKIIANLSFKQFGLALGGGLISFFLFVLLSPIVGTLSLVIVIPVAMCFAYISFGSYNGRTAEQYLFKFFEYFTKTKKLKYQRKPFVRDLDDILAKWTATAISSRWDKEIADKKAQAENKFLDFSKQSSEEKAQAITQLSEIMNESKTNIMANLLRKEEQLRSIQSRS